MYRTATTLHSIRLHVRPCVCPLRRLLLHLYPQEADQDGISVRLDLFAKDMRKWWPVAAAVSVIELSKCIRNLYLQRPSRNAVFNRAH